MNSALSRIHLVDLMLDQIFLIEEKRYDLTTVDSLPNELSFMNFNHLPLKMCYCVIPVHY